MSYKFTKKGEQDSAHTSVIRKSDGLIFPLNTPGNRDYDEYKRWLDSGNTTEASD